MGGHIAVAVPDQVPNDGESQPGQDEAQGEYQQRPAPLNVDQGGEYILQVGNTPNGRTVVPQTKRERETDLKLVRAMH